MRNHSITISSTDYSGLLSLVDSARLDRRVSAENLDALERELARAKVVDPSEISDDVITMNAKVWFRDLDSDEMEEYTLVYPSKADVLRDRISVLAPIGTALLGYRIGDIVKWRVPSGKRRFEIVDVVQMASDRRFDEAHALA
jgi:regulator of nucleoside diphosphate kinase